MWRLGQVAVHHHLGQWGKNTVLALFAVKLVVEVLLADVWRPVVRTYRRVAGLAGAGR
ncbi:hypothetical protein D3C85_1870650 [compost metagenome]